MDYYFLSNEEFQRRVGAGEFIEWASYGGHRYGTLRSQVERKLALGKHVVLDIEVIGARQVRQGFTNSVHVFILPPSAGTLTRRLAGRKTEDRAALLRRMEHAAQELGQVFEYEYVVVNDDLPRAIAEVTAIVDAETRRVTRCVGLAGLVETMRRDVAAERERIERGHLPVPD